MSLVLLVFAGLFIRAQYTMFTADPGFETRRVLFVPLQAPLAAVADRILIIPGVESVASGSPLSQEEQGPATQEVRTPWQPPGSGKRVATTDVSTNYFDTLEHPAAKRPASDQRPRGGGIAGVSTFLLARQGSDRRTRGAGG